MGGMMQYYLTRLAIAAFLVGFLLLMGSPWWIAGLLGVLVVVYFLWALRGGRFAISAAGGVTPLRRDERGQIITYRSGLIGFVVLMLGIGVVAVCFASVLRTEVPVAVVSLLGLLGMAAYIVSDISLHRM